MKLGNTFKIAFLALRRNKMRTLLTALGMIIGVAAVITMDGIGNGAKAQIRAQISSLGERLINVYAGNFSAGGVRTGWFGASTLTVEDTMAILREIPSVVAASPEVRSNGQLIAGNANWFTTELIGEAESFFDIRQWPFARGTAFSDEHVRRADKVAVIGATIARELFGDEDPVGQTMRIRNVPFVIVGVLVPKGLNMYGQDPDDLVVVPYTTAMKRLFGRTFLTSILVEVATESDLGPAEAQIISLLRQRHNIIPPKEDDFRVRNQEDVVRMATESTNVMTALLGATALVSLLVGGIGIMNIMLVSVTERTREIGIRIAVGARSRDILLQFLIEAATLSSTGGILGVILGIAMAKLMSVHQGWPSLVSIESIAVAFLFSTAVGIFFGFYPARKASQLDPIEALRYE